MFKKILNNMPNIVEQIYDTELQREMTNRGYSFLRIPLFIGRLNVKLNKNSLYSERNNRVPTMVIGRFRITWRKYQ